MTEEGDIEEEEEEQQEVGQEQEQQQQAKLEKLTSDENEEVEP
jgi:hypothetical protein